MTIEQFPFAGFYDEAATLGAKGLMMPKIGHVSAWLKDDIFLQMILYLFGWAQLATLAMWTLFGRRDLNGFINVIRFTPKPSWVAFRRAALFLFIGG